MLYAKLQTVRCLQCIEVIWQSPQQPPLSPRSQTSDLGASQFFVTAMIDQCSTVTVQQSTELATTNEILGKV